MNGDEPFLHGDRAQQVQEERLAGAVLADQEPHAGTAVADAVQVFDHGTDLFDPADLDVVLAEAGDHP